MGDCVESGEKGVFFGEDEEGALCTQNVIHFCSALTDPMSDCLR